MESIVGRWRLDRTKDTGVKAFLVATGVPEGMHELLMSVEPTVEWSIVGDSTLKQKTEFQGERPREYTYQLGKQFEMEKIDGLKLKCTVTWDGRMFTESYIDFKGDPFQNERTIQGDVMTVVSKAKGVTMTQELHRC